MQYLLQLFGTLPFSTVIIFIAAIAFLVAITRKAYKFIVTVHDEFQEREQTLVDIKNNLTQITQKQDQLEESITTVIAKQQALAARQEEIETKNRTLALNKLRDTLLQSYRYYTSLDKNPMQAWSEMEKDSFDKLFADYEELGGNGFMHSTVAPEMALLRVISMNDSIAITDLMKSRKG